MIGSSVAEVVMVVSLLGAFALMTLKGTAAIDSIKAYLMIRQFQAFQSAVMTYQAQFGSLPGEDGGAPRRYLRPPSTLARAGMQISLIGNGALDGELYDQLSPNSETFMAWRDLRYFEAIPGDPKVAGASAMPENPFGGFYGFDQGNLGQKGGSLCATRISGRAAQMIDNRLDDGKINTGDVVATSKFSIEQNHHFDAPDTTPYDFEKEYIICVPMLP